ASGLPRRPLFERGGVIQVQPLEEVAAQQRGGFPGPGGDARLEGQRVYGEGDVAQRQGLTPAHEPLRAEAGAQATDHLIQGVAGPAPAPVRPPAAQAAVSRAGSLWRVGAEPDWAETSAPPHGCAGGLAA